MRNSLSSVMWLTGHAAEAVFKLKDIKQYKIKSLLVIVPLDQSTSPYMKA